MIETIAPDVNSETASYPACGERRRADRAEFVSPALLPLLRGTNADDEDSLDGNRRWDLRRPELALAKPDDDLGTFKGILVAVAVGAAAWAAAVWLLPALVGPFVT